jgi:hypothetical protein
MTLDGGWGYILSTVLGVVLMWIGGLVSGHFRGIKRGSDDSHERIDQSNERVDQLEREFLKYQTHAADTFARISGVERMETNIFAVLARLEHKVDNVLKQGS